MPLVYVSIGSNLGDRASYLQFAKRELLAIAGLTDLQCSPVYETEPVAAEGGPFLNAVWSFAADLSPQDLLKKLQEIEVKANRQRNKPYSPSKALKVNGTSPGNPSLEEKRCQDKPNEARTLDLDILFYGDQVTREPGMIIPHPRLHERAFVLEPMAKLDPDFVHPVLKKTVKELLKAVSEKR